MEKKLALMPMPTASVSTARTVNPGCRRRVRNAWRRSVILRRSGKSQECQCGDETYQLEPLAAETVPSRTWLIAEMRPQHAYGFPATGRSVRLWDLAVALVELTIAGPRLLV